LLAHMLRLEPWETLSIDPAFEQKIMEVINTEGIDLIFCRYMAIAKYLIRLRDRIGARVIVDLDDIETVKNERQIRSHERPGSYSYYRKRLDNKLFELYHRNLRHFDKVFVCSQEDKA